MLFEHSRHIVETHLVTKEVFSGREGSGNSVGPRAPLVDQLALAPVAVSHSAVDEANFVDLELQGSSRSDKRNPKTKPAAHIYPFQR